MPRFVPIEELFKGRHVNQEIVVLCVRWYLSFRLSFHSGVRRAEGRDSLARSADLGGYRAPPSAKIRRPGERIPSLSSSNSGVKTQPKAQIPTNTQDHDFLVDVPTFEQFLDWYESRHLPIIPELLVRLHQSRSTSSRWAYFAI